MNRWWILIGLAVFAVAGMARAQDTDAGMKLELNRLEPADDACRAYLVIENRTPAAFTRFRYDLVIFDSDGIVSRRLALETGPLPAGKTSLKVFDLAGLPCDRIGRILINDVLECADGTGRREDCLPLVEPGSRTGTPLIR
ncbi:Tat pathway signal sequence domain protein [Minwuia sp.]|uniref:Tat pathway signal sequence domain protein n=1 Tax=Minwuia sp. TaxID=2493630 RepID=UPI003A8F6617